MLFIELLRILDNIFVPYCVSYQRGKDIAKNATKKVAHIQYYQPLHHGLQAQGHKQWRRAAIAFTRHGRETTPYFNVDWKQ